MAKASLVVLISGSGSNLQAIIDAIKAGQLDAEISAVISNNASARGLDRAAAENITSHVVDHNDYPNREMFDKALIDIIDPLHPDLVILAGFMRILTEGFIKQYHHRLINIHPSLLPRYKGLHTHQQAIDNADKIHGASVHYVSYELDSGPVILQAEVPVKAGDTEQILAARVLVEEHKIYPKAIELHISGRVTFDDDLMQFDGKPLSAPLLLRDGKLVNEQLA